MKIKDNLPFEECYGCKECILSVDDTIVMFAEDHVVGKEIIAGCRNADKCIAMMETEGRTMRYAWQE